MNRKFVGWLIVAVLLSGSLDVLLSAAPPAEKPSEKSAAPDVLTATLIAVPVSVDRTAAEVRYRISSGKLKLPAVPASEHQLVERKSPTEAVITVRPSAAKPDSAKPDATKAERETLPIKVPAELAKNLAATFYLESDNELVRKLTVEALTGETGSAAAAARLQAFVHGHIKQKNLGVGFASAAQTAESRAGDCTEHAVLLAAMARAAGLPSRLVSGVAFAERFSGKPRVFVYHLWVEMFVEGRWRPYDAALHGQGGFGVGHIALLTDDGAGFHLDSRLGAALSTVMGQMQIEILEQKRP